MNRYVKILPLVAIFFTLSANAEVALKDSSEILGEWNLYAEAAKLDGEKKAVKIEWEFKKDGTLQTTSTDSVGRTKEMKIAIKYSVENGEIKKQTTPGREKYESCKVVEKEGSNMILKCTYLYFFLTKK
ncbi:MAG: hypothetical protein PSV18_01215 [Methylobacter sp.]|uniref:Lipocalin-like domain-containing protein n=1 Tax=Candidatus Methylobacter titanis TaxID=3053457 RepID=A0AA43TKA9_9GAMM|nr:hypothetical protein [Candidatus Methylobacter titanis]MDI1291349.1 hypothetical protein [Candidatus Methylobacter titanis]